MGALGEALNGPNWARAHFAIFQQPDAHFSPSRSRLGIARELERLAKLEKAMNRAYREVADWARNKKTDMRVAAYGIALQRIESVYKEREIFP